ncbi:MAG TPA: hypothetical protein VNV66_03885 [Pilimelia sp.]|nr:hypothetical protein [Pilimelia sp.]
MGTRSILIILALSGALTIGGGLVGVLSDGTMHDLGMASLVVGGVGAVLGFVALSFRNAKK